MTRPTFPRKNYGRYGFEHLEPRVVLSASNAFGQGLAQIHTIGNESFSFIADPPEIDIAAAELPDYSGTFEGLEQVLVSELPALHSNPGAAVDLFLDLDGHFESAWGAYINVLTPVYDIDGDDTTFNETELSRIYTAWQMVAEDFAPFDINVTNVEPAVLAQGVSSDDANGVALRVAVGGSWQDWYGSSAGGVGYINSFTTSIPNTVFVFSDNTSSLFGETSSHEAGHGFGLRHQSLYDGSGTKIEEYYSGTSTWQPIMGGGTTSLSITSTWYNGTSSEGPSVFQDDMAVIAGVQNGFGYRADDHGNASGAATLLANDGVYWTGAGIIETNNDVDVFQMSPVASGEHRLRVDVESVSPNLDAVLELRDSYGAVLASASPTGDKGVDVVVDLTAGENYYLHVTKVSAYGYVGNYAIAGNKIALGPRVTTADPAGIANIAVLDSIQVTFANPVDPATLEAADIALTGPSGAISVAAVTPVAGSGDTQFDVSFAAQTEYGAYTLVVGPDVLDPAGNPMNQDLDVVTGETSEDQFVSSVTLQPTDIAIGHAELVEGNGGVQQLLFTVTRTGDPSVEFTAEYATLNGSATGAGDAGTVAFRYRPITEGQNFTSVDTADLDGDGDVDIAGAVAVFDEMLVWYENRGNDGFLEHVIDDTENYPRSIETVDMDGDGDSDLLTVLHDTNTFSWQENDGAGNFSERIISTNSADGALDAVAADVDGDGDMDVLGTHDAGDKVVWYENTGSAFTEHDVATGLDGARNVAAADLDGDGDIDAVSTASTADIVSWHENDGAGVFTTHLITSERDPRHLAAGDLDNDGDLDVVVASASDDSFLWYKNDGSGNFVEHVLTDSANNANSMSIADMDGDGDNDITAASINDDTVAWFENDGQANFTEHVISSTPESDREPVAADIDGDGDLDVLAVNFSPGGLGWYENSLFNSSLADYQPTSGTLTFAANQTQRAISVTVFGDVEIESDETFFVNVTSDFATVSNGNAVGTILDDDQPVLLFSDSFENGQWDGLWVEDSQNDWFTSAQRAADGAYSAEVDGDANNAELTMSAPLDLTGYETAQLTFDWLIENGFDNGEYLSLDISVDGGASWQNDVRRLNGNSDAENVWHGESVDLSAYMSAETLIRFRADVSRSNEDANVDNLRIIAGGAAAPNVLPNASAGGPYAVDEGSSVTLDASGSTDTDGTIVSYEWELNGDGQYDDATGATVNFSSNQDGPHTVEVRVHDDRGGFSTDSAVVTVANVAPAADAGGPYVGAVGVDVTLDASGSTDPGFDIASYQWDLDADGQYDDGTGPTTLFSSTIPNTYTVAVRVTDDNGGVSTDSTTVEISAAPAETIVFADSFENGQWDGLWIEDGQNDWFNSTQRATEGNYSAEVDGRADNAQLTMSAPLDLTGYETAELTFDWLIENGFDSGEFLSLDISVDGGASWQNDVRRLNGNSDAENTWHGESVDLTAYMSAETFIRFRADVNRSNEDANLDNVRVTAGGPAAEALGDATSATPQASVASSSDALTHDLLVGKSRRDLLIGGAGANRIVGSADDDMLIAALAHFSAANTDAVMARWLADSDAALRKSAVDDYLSAENLMISDDDVRDVLTGSSGTDSFFASLDGEGELDKVTDLDDALLVSDLNFILAG